MANEAQNSGGNNNPPKPQQGDRPVDRPVDSPPTVMPRSGPQPIDIAPFEVEAGDVNNSSLIPIDTLTMRIRGAWDNANYAATKYQPSLGGIGQMPRIPGVRVAVNVRRGLVRVYDPLANDPDLCKKIEGVLSNPDNATIMPWGGEKVRPWDTSEISLDADKMKSLLLELARKTREPQAVRTYNVVNGEVPTVEAVNNLPGREIYDPWSNSREKPRYVDQVDAWQERLHSAGREGMVT